MAEDAVVHRHDRDAQMGGVRLMRHTLMAYVRLSRRQTVGVKRRHDQQRQESCQQDPS